MPAECFEKQGQQALLLTTAANQVIRQKPVENFWQAVQNWKNDKIKAVVLARDYLACRYQGEASG